MLTHRRTLTTRAIQIAVAVFVLLGLVLMIAPAIASASTVPGTPSKLELPSLQFWTLIIGALAPLVGYLVNHYMPWVNEKVKAFVHVALAAAVGVVYPLIADGSWSFDTRHLQLVGTAVAAALFTHRLLWAPSTIAASLGAGTNAQDNPAR